MSSPSHGARPVGTGGGLPYRQEQPTQRMICQGRPFSCLAACVRQMLLDASVRQTEEELLLRIGYIEGLGSTVDAAAEALTQLQPAHEFAGGSVDPESLGVLSSITPWIAVLRTNHGSNHAVLVDKIEDNGVRVRDPWGLDGPGSVCGTEALMGLAEFKEHWFWALNKCVFIRKPKR